MGRSLLPLELVRAIGYTALFYYMPSSGFASAFSLVAFYVQVRGGMEVRAVDTPDLPHPNRSDLQLALRQRQVRGRRGERRARIRSRLFNLRPAVG